MQRSIILSLCTDNSKERWILISAFNRLLRWAIALWKRPRTNVQTIDAGFMLLTVECLKASNSFLPYCTSHLRCPSQRTFKVTEEQGLNKPRFVRFYTSGCADPSTHGLDLILNCPRPLEISSLSILDDLRRYCIETYLTFLGHTNGIVERLYKISSVSPLLWDCLLGCCPATQIIFLCTVQSLPYLSSAAWRQPSHYSITQYLQGMDDRERLGVYSVLSHMRVNDLARLLRQVD